MREVNRGNPTGTFRGIKRARNYLRRRCRITACVPTGNKICLFETRGAVTREEAYIINY